MDDFDLIRNSAMFVDKMFAEVLIMNRKLRLSTIEIGDLQSHGR
jgi:hypothetical protein